jgi:hypothetical protein
LVAVGLAFSHSVAAMSGGLVAIQDGGHHFALAAQREFQIGSRRPMFGHSAL